MGRFFLIGIFLFLPFFTSAAEKIEVVPAFQELAFEAGQNLDSEITINNQTSSEQQFFIRSVSFQALDTSGGVAFLGTDINNNDLPQADFITFENDSLTVAAGKTGVFSFQIRDQEALAPGGHYAAIVFQSFPVTDENSSEKIAVRQIFSSLIFLEKKGGEIKELELQKFQFKPFLTFPNNIELHFTNNGNTHVVPRGTVQVRNPFGSIATQTALNESSSLLLPGQTRLFPVTLNYQPLLPGHYTLLVTYRYDGTEKGVMAEETFFLLPYQFVIIGSVGILLLLTFRKKLSLRKKSHN